MPLPASTKARLRKKLTSGLKSVAVALVNEAKVRATQLVDTGEYRNSITYSETGQGQVLFGLPNNKKNVALELGFKPHFLPVQYAGTWMRRHGVGIVKARSQSRTKSGKRSTRTRQFLSAGIYVGGPRSRLEYGGGGASGERSFYGRKRFLRWRTKGGQSKYLPAGKVGFSVIRHTVRTRARVVAPAAFLRGYSRG
jgi:hypothetical protein